MLKGVQAATTTVTKMNKIHTQKQQQQKHFTAREICVERNSVRYIPVNVCIKQVNNMKITINELRGNWISYMYVNLIVGKECTGVGVTLPIVTK